MTMDRAIKEHGILFSWPMVLAILDRRKRVTRRLDLSWLKVKAGDHLWVRENWRTGASLDKYNATQIRQMASEAGYRGGVYAPIWYEADGAFRRWGDSDEKDFGGKGRLRIGRFMPRWASRLVREVTEDARKERLWDITEEEARLEGLQNFPNSTGDHWGVWEADCWEPTARGAFARLWSTLHTKPGERFEDNPTLARLAFDYQEVAR
jgi:hypothetical protein